MSKNESLNHSSWECKYHVVFMPKYRKKTLYTEVRMPVDEELKAQSGR